MIPVLLRLVILLGAAQLVSAAAEPLTQGELLDERRVAEDVAVGLDFIAPRALDAVPVPQLTLWGLRGLTTLDPRLTTELTATGLVLRLPDRTLLARPVPAAGDFAGWGTATAQLSRAAWDASNPVRRAGTEGVVRGFFDELFNHLDPYSRYTPPDEAEADRIRRAGAGGIGAAIAAIGRRFVLVDVQPDGPAASAGLRAGDAVSAIDGTAVRGQDVADVAALLAGPEETRVTLTMRGHDGQLRDIDLIRALVPAPTVAAARVAEALVLKIGGFARNTAARLGQEVARGVLAPRRPRGIVLDLRGNRGGLLRQAVSAAEVLLVSGTVATTTGRDPEADHMFQAAGADRAGGLPVIVIVDGRSASAAEVLAAALADRGRAVVVGSATLGKGLVQTITPLPDGGELFVTWSRIVAPGGWPLQGLGVLPQVCTSLGEATLRDQLAELARGHQPFEEALARHRDARAPIPPAEMLEIRAACPAAEGRDSDLAAAHFLLTHPVAYATALLEPVDDSAVP